MSRTEARTSGPRSARVRRFEQGRELARQLAATERKKLGDHDVWRGVSESGQQKALAFLQASARVRPCRRRSKQRAEVGAHAMHRRQLDEGHSVLPDGSVRSAAAYQRDPVTGSSQGTAQRGHAREMADAKQMCHDDENGQARGRLDDARPGPAEAADHAFRRRAAAPASDRSAARECRCTAAPAAQASRASRGARRALSANAPAFPPARARPFRRACTTPGTPPDMAGQGGTALQGALPGTPCHRPRSRPARPAGPHWRRALRVFRVLQRGTEHARAPNGRIARVPPRSRVRPRQCPASIRKPRSKPGQRACQHAVGCELVASAASWRRRGAERSTSHASGAQAAVRPSLRVEERRKADEPLAGRPGALQHLAIVACS